MLKIALILEGAEEAAGEFEAWSARLERSPGGLLREIAEDWETRVFPDLFERGGDPPWAPLSPKTMKIHGAQKPLEGRGILRHSIRVFESTEFEAVVGSEIGEIHLEGGVTGANSILPGREIPVRDFLSIPDSEISASFERIFSFYIEDL